MNNNDYIKKHSDILSFRELADGTIATYVSYLRIFLDWVTSELEYLYFQEQEPFGPVCCPG